MVEFPGPVHRVEVRLFEHMYKSDRFGYHRDVHFLEIITQRCYLTANRTDPLFAALAILWAQPLQLSQ